MAVGIDQPGYNGRTMRVYHFRGRAGETGNVITDRDDQPLANCHGGSARLLRIDRVNARIYNREIGRLRVSGRREGGGQNKSENPHIGL